MVSSHSCVGGPHVSVIVPTDDEDDDDEDDELEDVDVLDELAELDVEDELELEQHGGGGGGGGGGGSLLDELDELSELATLDDELDEATELELDKLAVELEDAVLLDELAGGAELDEVDDWDSDGAGFCVTGVLLHATSATASIPAARTAMCFIPLP